MADTARNRMETRPLGIANAFLFTLPEHHDQRGILRPWFDEQAVHAATGTSFDPAQANLTISHRGALRGIKYHLDDHAAKYITCLTGAVLDVVVDLRVGSPTFGTSHIERLDSDQPTGVFLGPGLGHATLALTEQAAVAYLLPTRADAPEAAIHPFDPDLDIAWPSGLSFLLSDGDNAAPTLTQAHDDGLLPVYLEGDV